MVRQIFKKCVIAVAGPLPGQYTTQNLKRWIQIRKGRFTDKFDETVTHLLCTNEQYEAKIPRGKCNKQLGYPMLSIHSYFLFLFYGRGPRTRRRLSWLTKSWFVFTVKEALALGKRFKLVDLGWFEFSCVLNHKEPENKYLMTSISAKQNAEKREKRRIEKGIRDGEKFVNTSKSNATKSSLSNLPSPLHVKAKLTTLEKTCITSIKTERVSHIRSI
jgi:hypothetical protein